jgi:uncharacterized protein
LIVFIDNNIYKFPIGRAFIPEWTALYSRLDGPIFPIGLTSMPEKTNASASIPRHAEPRVKSAMADTRIVALVGPRQSGKTTLARKIAADRRMNFITLDDAQLRAFANEDPSGFVRDLDRAVIDEIQRAPNLILALKKVVDEDTRAGRFLITGSVDLFRGTLSPDSLAGRVETIELLPFSQTEIAYSKAPSAFLKKLFKADFPALKETGRSRDLTQRALAGGYPEALVRETTARRQAWHLAYARALATRDVAEIAEVSKTAELSRLVEHAGLASGDLVNLASLASALRVDAKTVDRWLTLLEQMFVIRRVPAWHRNDLKRLVKSPKLQFLDSGLLASLRRLTADDIRADRTKFGDLLEAFVFSELSKLAGLTDDAISISHYRDKDQIEVDFVLENARKVAGIEVKAAASVTPDDFIGLKRLQEATGKAFACGIILHDGDRIQKAGEKLFAMPVSALWT